MLLRKSNPIRSSEITPQQIFRAHQQARREARSETVIQSRRKFLATASTFGIGALTASHFAGLSNPETVYAASRLLTVPSKYTVSDPETPAFKSTNYNNFYEFGTRKDDPANNAHTLQTHPWTVEISGLVKKPRTVGIDDLMKYRPIENRTYRFRCVEGWSMVIPWNGYSLSELLNLAGPLPSAKFVQFVSLYDPKQMPDAGTGYAWPYTEGLRMDEAMHPLTLLTVGSYGDVLTNQQGAPVRVVVPWKYGFKSAKSIVKIRLVDKQPNTTWNDKRASEYGFYSNVNPAVDHPRWSQAHERHIDSSSFPRTIPTLPFNGYANEVASMYAGMDLQKFF
jgi:sulfoxide reductase catalytic subunit YedY